ncbi:hypothetical protein U3516DRAFT_739464 [Neocallimastix sp. 'constans']
MTVRLVQQLTSNTNDSSLKSSKLQLNGTGKMTNFYFIPQLSSKLIENVNIANTNVTSQLTSFFKLFKFKSEFKSRLGKNLNSTIGNVNDNVRDADEACFIKRWKCLLCPLLTINKSNSNLNKSSSSLTQQLIENINGSSQYHSYLVQQLSIKLIIINGYGLISPLIPQLLSWKSKYHKLVPQLNLQSCWKFENAIGFVVLSKIHKLDFQCLKSLIQQFSPQLAGYNGSFYLHLQLRFSIFK